MLSLCLFIRNLMRPAIGLLFLSFFVPGTAFAAGPITARIIPETPGAFTPVTVRVESFLVDMRASRIVWLENGDLALEGLGATEYKFTTGDIGEQTTLEILITTPDGKKFKETLSLRPGAVDILWQADTYTPPFYKGKALPTYRSMIRATAIPQFGSKTPSALTPYKWTLNQSTGLGQGTGVSTAVAEVGPLGSSVQLRVDAGSGAERAVRTVSIPSIAPEVLFYEDSPLYGIRFEKALLGTVATADIEYRIHGVPFFFAKPDRDGGNLVYKWYIDNQFVQMNPGINEWLTILRADGAKSIEHTVALKAQNGKRPTQRGGQVVKVLFTESNL